MGKAESACLIAVRVKGSAGLRQQTRAALESLNLKRRNQAIILPNNPSVRGVLRSLKDTLIWGYATEEMLTSLLYSRSRVEGSSRLTDAEAKKKFGVEDLRALSRSLSSGVLKPQELRRRGVSTVFNLHPPKQGFRSLKDPAGRGGDLGSRQGSLKEVLMRMI
ncbi:MAG: uL30 family ribosomal protein [Candidatus Bathyarchaeia archaeon]